MLYICKLSNKLDLNQAIRVSHIEYYISFIVMLSVVRTISYLAPSLTFASLLG